MYQGLKLRVQRPSEPTLTVSEIMFCMESAGCIKQQDQGRCVLFPTEHKMKHQRMYLEVTFEKDNSVKLTLCNLTLDLDELGYPALVPWTAPAVQTLLSFLAKLRLCCGRANADKFTIASNITVENWDDQQRVRCSRCTRVVPFSSCSSSCSRCLSVLKTIEKQTLKRVHVSISCNKYRNLVNKQRINCGQ